MGTFVLATQCARKARALEVCPVAVLIWNLSEVTPCIATTTCLGAAQSWLKMVLCQR